MRHAMIIILILAAALSAGALIYAQEANDERKDYLYQWTDGQGVVHITDRLGEVPEQFRPNVRKIEGSRKSEAGPETEVQMNAGGLIAPQNAGGDDEAQKASWKNRIQEWKARLADAERRYRELDQQRTELLMSWGGPAYGPIENKVKAEQIEQQMKATQGQIEEARHMLDVVIPEDARKAGIPPGWLRE
jgi:hypothetical protein